MSHVGLGLQGGVVSVCHIRDLLADASCRADEHCGVDGHSCRQRRCSQHGFCVTPQQVSEACLTADRAAVLPAGGQSLIASFFLGRCSRRWCGSSSMPSLLSCNKAGTQSSR